MHYTLSNSLGRPKMNLFSPLQLSPALWLDAADPLTLYTGGSLAAPDGAISEWRDKSGNGRHATQATGVSQPLRKTVIQNGRDVVRFDGANDHLDINFTQAQPYTRFTVVKSRSAENGNHVIMDGGIADNSYLIFSSANTVMSYAGATLTQVVGPSNVFRNYYQLYNGVNSAITANGGTPTVGNAGSNTAVNFRLAGRAQFGFFADCDFAEVLIFPTALSDAARQAVESYLNAKWNLY